MSNLILPPGYKAAAVKADEFRQCQSSGCLRRAQYVPKLVIPARGYPVEANKNASLIINIPVCEDHAIYMKPEQILNDHVRRVVDRFARGKVPPDYERAVVLPIVIESPEYKMWARDQQRGRTQ